jgi:hypothetical protein
MLDGCGGVGGTVAGSGSWTSGHRRSGGRRQRRCAAAGLPRAVSLRRARTSMPSAIVNAAISTKAERAGERCLRGAEREQDDRAERERHHDRGRDLAVVNGDPVGQQHSARSRQRRDDSEEQTASNPRWWGASTGTVIVMAPICRARRFAYNLPSSSAKELCGGGIRRCAC